MLAAAVHAGKWLFMQQAYRAMPQGNLLHDVHDEHVLTRRQVCRVVNQLVLGGRGFVVLRLGRDLQLPELSVEAAHIMGCARLIRAEAMILHRLSLGRRRAKGRAPVKIRSLHFK